MEQVSFQSAEGRQSRQDQTTDLLVKSPNQDQILGSLRSDDGPRGCRWFGGNKCGGCYKEAGT